MLVIIITFILAFFILADLIPIYKSKQWKLFWVYSVLMVIVYALSILIALEVEIPSPATPLKKLIITIFRLYGNT